MTPDEVRALIRQRLHSEASFVVFPDPMPAWQEERVRSIHRAWLPDDEPILALYDDTLLGTGADGFALTSRRLVWRNFLGHPRQLLFSDLDPSAIDLDEDGFVVAESQLSAIAISQREALAGLLQELGERHHGADLPQGGLTSSIHPATLIKQSRWFVGEVPSVFYAPALPQRKHRTVRRVHQLADTERVLVIIDDTLLGSAAEGIVLTSHRLCWKALLQPPQSLPWGEVGRRLDPTSLRLTLRPDILTGLTGLLREVSDELSASPGRVFCWSCRSEVRLNAGHCSGCGRVLVSAESSA